eukprot:13639985-Alexandrium_andersonii.AAC.1
MRLSCCGLGRARRKHEKVNVKSLVKKKKEAYRDRETPMHFYPLGPFVEWKNPGAQMSLAQQREFVQDQWTAAQRSRIRGFSF